MTPKETDQLIDRIERIAAATTYTDAKKLRMIREQIGAYRAAQR